MHGLKSCSSQRWNNFCIQHSNLWLSADPGVSISKFPKNNNSNFIRLILISSQMLRRSGGTVKFTVQYSVSWTCSLASVCLLHPSWLWIIRFGFRFDEIYWNRANYKAQCRIGDRCLALALSSYLNLCHSFERSLFKLGICGGVAQPGQRGWFFRWPIKNNRTRFLELLKLELLMG